MVTANKELGGLRAEAIEWRHGWLTVLSAAIGYGAGPVLLLTTASVFIKPTIQATGWSTTEVLISPFISFLFAALGPVVRRVADRTSPKKTVAAGLVVYAVLLVLFALVPLNRATFYGIGAAIGIAGAFAYMVPINQAVAAWFDRSSGKAFGLVGAGGAAMPLLAIPAVTAVIYAYSWRDGYLALAGFALVIALPSIIVGLRSRPAGKAQEQDVAAAADHPTRARSADVSSILHKPRFWLLFVSVICGSGAASAFLANVQPILLDGGLSVVAATSITTLVTLGVVVGRLGSGVLLDGFNRYAVAATVLTLSGLGGLALTQTSAMPYWLVFIAAIVLMFSQGAEGDIFSVITLRDYGRKNFGQLFALCYVASGIGSLSMPYAFSYVRDATGSYSAAAAFGGALYILAAFLTVTYAVLGPRSRRSRSVAGIATVVNTNAVKVEEAELS